MITSRTLAAGLMAFAAVFCVMVVIAASPPVRAVQPPAATLPPNGTPVPQWMFSYFSSHSPSHSTDERWEAVVNANEPVMVRSLSGDDMTYTDSVPLGKYVFFRDWFPDNSGFFMMDADEGCERCPFDRLILFQINTTAGRLERFVYEPVQERNKAFWNSPAWSPDGARLAVIVNMRRIVVLDRQARPIEELTLRVVFEADIVDQVVWTPFGVVYAVRNLHGFPAQLIQIFREAPGGDELLFSGYDYPRVVAADPTSPRLLIAHQTNRPGFTYSGEIAVLHMETKMLEQVIYEHGDHYPYYSLMTSGTCSCSTGPPAPGAICTCKSPGWSAGGRTCAPSSCCVPRPPPPGIMPGSKPSFPDPPISLKRKYLY